VLDLIWVPLVPRPKGNSQRIILRGGYPRVLPSKSATACESALVAQLRRSAPPEPLLGPLWRDVTFCLPIPRSWPKWRQRAAVERRSLPAGGGGQADLGNLVKLLDDALERSGHLRNDGQIVGGTACKVHAEEPGYLVRLQPIHQASRLDPGAPLERGQLSRE